jgi:hypothetical protein
MTQIVLPREQADVVARAIEPIEVCDPNGELLGYIDPVWTREDIDEAKRRIASDQPRYTTAQVMKHLQSLESK